MMILKLNYSGKGTSYFAVNKLTTQEDFFNTLQERDRMVKLGTHEKPRTRSIPSKEVRFKKYRFDFGKKEKRKRRRKQFLMQDTNQKTPH
jgi:hypothetical protein